jgi:hypothetical protein
MYAKKNTIEASVKKVCNDSKRKDRIPLIVPNSYLSGFKIISNIILTH